MADKPYVIRISSQKGGVGKTTIAVNLSVALSIYSYKTLLVDADTTNPSVGFALGLEQVNKGYQDVIYGDVKLKDAVALHSPSGLYVLPGTLHPANYRRSVPAINNIIDGASSESYEFIIIDTAPGLSAMEPAQYLDEALIVSTPDISSFTSSIRLSKLCDKYGIHHNMVVNRYKNKRYEVSIREIEELYGNRILATVPESEDVPLGIADHIPTYMLQRKSPFSLAIKEVARIYASKGGRTIGQQLGGGPGRGGGGGLIGWIRRILGI
ncbi:MAG: AAA family ATPase [Candidatus Micrarchaeota archaeon]|nr:AAA family ATPase [Candidatus Micrarchaeota archaeon]